MNEVYSPLRTLKTLRVKKKIDENQETPKQKVYKIAKKITQEAWHSPIPDSIQEDFLLEGSKTPDLFLQYSPANSAVKVFSPFPTLQNNKPLSPTDIVGPLNLYYKKANSQHFPSLKTTSKAQASLEKLKGTKLTFVNFDEKLRSIREGMRTERENEKSRFKKMTPGGKISLLKQAKSLERYEKQQKYWKRLEENIADLVQKAQEELSLNSAKIYDMKKQEIEIIDRLQKLNEERGKQVWTNSLRSGLYSIPEPPLIIAPDMFSTLKPSSRFTKDLMKYTKKFNSPKGLRETDYFQEQLLNFDKNKDEILNMCSDQLLVRGRDKLKMEYDAARKLGVARVTEKVIDLIPETVIESNYDPKVLY